MPLREPSWAVAVGSRQEAARVLEAAQAHNEDDEVDCKQQVGEQLSCRGLLRFTGRHFLTLASAGGGGAPATSAFLRARLPGLLLLWPHCKPENWLECSKIVWQPETPNGVLPECVPLAQLPLPAQQTRGTAAPWEEAEAEAGEAGEDEASAMQAAARAAAAAQEVAEEEEGAEPSSPVEARDPWAQVQQPRQDWRWLPAVGTCYPSAAVK